MFTPDIYTVILAGVGITFALVGMVSWKLGKKKKARLEAVKEKTEESS